ncbi:hypothetical protein COCOBI_03-0210 [Coccomyxa sp. Obi]|nr:hypothetical protein COCOBI_03-0210 [Coccomyxa sp. Obi]
MTHQGGYQPLNYIQGSASLSFEVTLETAAHFLIHATLKDATDDLASPACASWPVALWASAPAPADSF